MTSHSFKNCDHDEFMIEDIMGYFILFYFMFSLTMGFAWAESQHCMTEIHWWAATVYLEIVLWSDNLYYVSL